MESSANESTDPAFDSIMSDICLSCRNLLDSYSLLPVSGCSCCDIIERARVLFEDCLFSHSECEMPIPPPLPSRVLDVGEAGDASDPFLYVPDDASQGQGSYVALSYCWGEDTGSFVMTTNSNIHERRAGIPLSSLPTTLREAVYITRRLNIRYLWIDALCIIQGSEDDWTSNAAKMDEIYGNAVLTIAAASAKSCTEGVLKPRLFKYWNVPPEADVDSEPINHRAWTLQERLLARRFLSFRTNYITWQCQTQTIKHSEYKDSRPLRSALRFYHMTQRFKNSSALWERIITDYTARYLTHENDKLPALSGIAKMIQSRTGDQYLSGLWRNDILRQLCWSSTSITVLEHIDPQKPKDYRAPSWSWASLDGNITFSSGTPPFKAAFVDCTVQPLFTNDPFGQVRKGTLVLEGRLKQFEVRWQIGKESEIPALFEPEGSYVGIIWPDTGGWNAPEEIRAEWRAMKPWCLQMTAGIFLLLLHVKENGSDNLQRVGIAHAERGDWFQGTSRRTVSII
jgi:hypothetical protein